MNTFDAPNSAEEKAMEQCIKILSEHFETVSIFTSNYVGGEKDTEFRYVGYGNWFARFGQVYDWITKQKHRARLEEEDDYDDGEDDE